MWNALVEIGDPVNATTTNLTPADAGKFFLVKGQATVNLMPPDQFPTGPLGFKKDEPGSGYVNITRSDAASGGTIGGWKHIALPLQDDYVHLWNTGTEYKVLAISPNNGLRGQHRTYVRWSTNNPPVDGGPSYLAHHGDRGSLIRAVMVSANGNIYLPDPADMGWTLGGYRNSFSIAVQLVAPTPVGNFVLVHGTNATIRNLPNGCVIDKTSQVVEFDFDTAEWHVTRNYVPSGLADRP